MVGNIKIVSYSPMNHFPGNKIISEYYLTVLPSLSSCINLHQQSTQYLANKETIYPLKENIYLPSAIINHPYSIIVSTKSDDNIQKILSDHSWLQFKLIKKGTKNIYQLYGTPTILGNAEIHLSSFWLGNIPINIQPSEKNNCYTSIPPVKITSRQFNSDE